MLQAGHPEVALGPKERPHRTMRKPVQSMNDVLPYLPTLVQLARTGSVSQTARELGVPRSTVSRRLVKLEANIGVKLAERTTHRLRFTDAGRRLVESAIGALAQLQTVREQVVAVASDVRGLLRVATPPGVSGTFIGWFLAFLHARHPGIDVELVVTERRPSRIEEGFDIVLAMGPTESSSWVRRRLTRAQLIAVATPGYLNAKGPPRDVRGLREHSLLTHQTPGVASSWPRLQGRPFAIAPRLVTNDLSTLREAALADMGIALVPVHVVLGDLGSGALVHVLADTVGEELDVFALYLPERRASPVLKAVLKAVAEFADAQTALTGATLRPRP